LKKKKKERREEGKGTVYWELEGKIQYDILLPFFLAINVDFKFKKSKIKNKNKKKLQVGH